MSARYLGQGIISKNIMTMLSVNYTCYVSGISSARKASENLKTDKANFIPLNSYLCIKLFELK